MTKAVRFHELGGPDVLRIDDVPVLEPRAGEVRIRARTLALNQADVMFRAGNHFFAPSFPQGQGLEAAGVVDSVGPDVFGLAIGDRVSVVPAFPIPDYNLHGELVIAPARAVVRHPENLSFVQAAALWMAYTTAYGGLIDIAQTQAGDVVVIGAATSSVGLAAIQIANLVGATPVALSRTGAKRDELLSAGATAVIATTEDDVAAQLREIAPDGVNVIFDSVGGPLLATLAEASASYGTIVVYGVLDQAPTPLPVMALLQRRLAIRGFDVVEVTSDDARLAKAVEFITAGVTDGALRPAIDRTFELDSVIDAYTYFESSRGLGKVVITLP